MVSIATSPRWAVFAAFDHAASGTADGSVGVTAIDKRPVSDPVHVHKLGLHADVHASRKRHGGELQALYVCTQEDADY